MKILIIGANGQLGSDCCSLFANKNETVGCDFPQVDIGNQSSIDGYLQEVQPDTIINCAAYTAVDGCESELDLSWKVNAEGPKFIAQAADRLGARLIHISTDYVFDGNKPAPEAYLESDGPNPLSQYGRSKLAGERAVIKYAPNHIILRTAWLYSSTGPNFLKTMLKLAITAPEREMKVVDDQYGSLTWSYNLASQIEKLISSDITGIAHTTSEGYSSWYGAARYFLDAMEVPYSMRPCTTAEYPTPAHRPANSILENKVLKDLQLNVFGNWQDHLDNFVEKHRDELLTEAMKEP
ncbi:MAG: dTDP-4-dehydrorhamnose reductase [Desulfobulbaceae bacterium]|nr:dTDP-4-dehydrorhamnose reductase [Desulfobulbaceae bacterium]